MHTPCIASLPAISGLELVATTGRHALRRLDRSDRHEFLSPDIAIRAPKVPYDHLDGGLRTETVIELPEFGYKELPTHDPLISQRGSTVVQSGTTWCCI